MPVRQQLDVLQLVAARHRNRIAPGEQRDAPVGPKGHVLRSKAETQILCIALVPAVNVLGHLTTQQ